MQMRLLSGPFDPTADVEGGDQEADNEFVPGSACRTKGTLLGTPNREPQEYSRNIMEYEDPGRYIPIIYLPYSWCSLFGVPSRVPLRTGYPRDPTYLYKPKV